MNSIHQTASSFCFTHPQSFKKDLKKNKQKELESNNSNMRRMKTQSVPESTNFKYIYKYSLSVSRYTRRVLLSNIVLNSSSFCVFLLWLYFNWQLNFLFSNETLCVCVCLTRLIWLVCVIIYWSSLQFDIILLLAFSYITFLSLSLSRVVLHSFDLFSPLVKVTCFDSASDATNTRTVYRSSCSGWRKKK